jgi:hypothetical protein
MDETSFASWTKVPHPSPVTAFAWAIEWKQRFPNTALPAHLLPSISQYFAVVDPKNPLSIVTAELLEQSQDAQSLGLDGIAANTVLELAKTALEQCKTAPPSHLLPALQVLLQAHQSAGFSEYAKPVLENWSNLEAKITSDSSEGKTEKSRVTLLQGELLHRLGKTEDALALLRGQMTSTPSIGLVAFCARLGLTDLLDEVLSSGIAIDTDPLSERWSCARPGQIASLGPKLKTPDAQHLLWASLHLLPQRLGIPKDGSQRRWSAPDRARVEQALRSWHPNFSQPTSATTVITMLSQISPAFGLLPGETGTKPCSLLAQQILKPDRSNDDHNWQRKQNKRQFLQAALERGDALALEVFLDTEDILSTEERYSYPSSSLQHSASLAALLPVIKATHQKAGSPELSGGFAGLVAATTNPEPAQRLNHNSWRYLVSLLPPREVATATRFLQQAAKHSPIPSRISADLLEQRSLVIPTESWLSSITKDEAYLESMQSIAASLQRDRDRTLAIKALDLALAYVGNRNPDLRIGLEQRKKWMLGEGIGLR